ncbi:hypothetical protein Tco_0778383 [Tanacetum coccineum]
MTVSASPKEPTKKSKRVKRPAKKSSNAPTVGVVIRDTPGVFVKKALKKSRQETHKIQASSSSEGANFESEVPDESKANSSNTSEGIGVKLGVPDVSKAYSSESDNKSQGDSEDDNESDDNNDEGIENDDDGGNDAQDSERTDLDEEENPNLNLNVDEEEETQEEEYVYTLDYYVPTDEETDDENKEFDVEEYDDLYKDVNVRSKVTEHEEKTEGSKQSSSVSSNFASKFLILDNVPPVIDEVASMINFKSTPTPEPTTKPSTTLIFALFGFSSLFEFDHRVSILEKELSQLKQVDHSTQILSDHKHPAMIDDHLSTRIRFSTQTALQSYMTEFEKKAQEEKDRYILVEKSIKDIIKDEVKSQLPQILPNEVSDFATPVIQSAINESLENIILAKSSSQPKSTYEAAASLTKFELKKILLDKIHKSKSYQAAP